LSAPLTVAASRATTGPRAAGPPPSVARPHLCSTAHRPTPTPLCSRSPPLSLAPSPGSQHGRANAIPGAARHPCHPASMPPHARARPPQTRWRLLRGIPRWAAAAARAARRRVARAHDDGATPRSARAGPRWPSARACDLHTLAAIEWDGIEWSFGRCGRGRAAARRFSCLEC